MVNNESTNKKPQNTQTKHRLYCEIDINKLDKRTRAGQAIIAMGDRLRDFVCVNNAVTDMLIQRILYKSLRLSMYETSKIFDDQFQEADHYLPMANSLRLDLAALAGMAGKPKAPDLNDYLKRVYEESEHNKNTD